MTTSRGRSELVGDTNADGAVLDTGPVDDIEARDVGVAIVGVAIFQAADEVRREGVVDAGTDRPAGQGVGTAGQLKPGEVFSRLCVVVSEGQEARDVGQEVVEDIAEAGTDRNLPVFL